MSAVDTCNCYNTGDRCECDYRVSSSLATKLINSLSL